LAVDQFEGGTHPLQPVEMEVDRAGAEVVATRLGYPGGATAGEERPENHDRGSHLSDQVERGLRLELLGHDDLELVVAAADVTADVSQHLRHERHVENVGNVAET